MTGTGFIKLHRKMLHWEWYTDIPVRVLFEHCLLKANYKEKKWRGHTIEAGSFITSYANLARETGLSVRQIRTAISKLKSTGEVTHKGQGSFSVITVNSWDDYQENDKDCDNLKTSERQSSDKVATTTKEYKERKNIKNDIYQSISSSNSSSENLENENLKFYGEFYNVGLTDKQFNQLEAITLSSKATESLIEDLSNAIERGKEPAYDSDLPNAHFVRLRDYWKWRKKNQVLEVKQSKPQPLTRDLIQNIIATAKSKELNNGTDL
jgi:DNA-binding transcriptional regulator YhcF (GntR family)